MTDLTLTTLPSIPLPDLSEAFERSGLIDVSYVLADSPVGQLLLAATPKGLVRVAYLGTDYTETAALEQLASDLSPRIVALPKRLDQPRRELEQFFSGERQRFDIPLDWALTPSGFRRRVLKATSRIPFGETLSYKQVAGAAGSANAFRAAGTALGSNPLPIVVPCHRVLHSGGGLGGYTGGVERKLALLNVEGHQLR